MKRSRRLVGALVLGGMSVAACSGGSGSAGSPGSGGGKIAGLTVAEATYGLAPAAKTDVTYQPDVIIVGGGAKSVRSVSSDGLVWTIDAAASHASDLAVGKVMFLTSSGAGRVAVLEKDGKDLKVTLMPVNITDVIKEGNLHTEQPINPNDFATRVIPDWPGAISDPGLLAGDTTGGGTGRAVALRPALASPANFPNSTGQPLPPATAGGAAEYTVGKWSVEPSLATNQAALKIGYNAGGVVFGGELTLGWNSPRMVYDLVIKAGKVVGGRFGLYGVNSLGLQLSGGSSVGVSGNVKTRIEVPLEYNKGFLLAGVPMNASLRWKFIVETAFSAKDSTISAKGVYQLSGPIGFDATSGTPVPLVPGVAVEQSLMKSLQGISVGVNGLVLAVQFKVLVGIGVEFATAGPFGAITVSTGVTVGSDVGLVKCRGATLQVELAGGVGATIGGAALPELEALAKEYNIGALKLDLELGVKKIVVNRAATLPPVKVCTG